MPKAKVFMGDVGSILLGFVFGVFVYNITTTPLDFLIFASLLFPFYIDELSTMTIRMKNGERLTVAHRKHLYQILVNENNMAHWQVSLLYGVVQCGIGLSIFTLKEKGIIAVLFFLLLASMSFVALSLVVRRRTQKNQ
jgi:UDP-N-acetylmuramyl pentapeptide phosphotransferase/UDP-N-acetylglucosamine-1-phosphate transferase